MNFYHKKILKFIFQLPVFGTDWSEPIYSTDNEDIIGQIEVLTGIGTEEQIENCKKDRGFKVITANVNNQKKLESKNNSKLKSSLKSKVSKVKLPLIDKDKTKIKTVATQNKSATPEKTISVEYKSRSTSPIKIENLVAIPDQIVTTCEKTTQVAFKNKQDAATQVDIKRNKIENTHLEMEGKRPTHNNITKELLATFLNQMMSQRQQSTLVERSTNTEPQTNPIPQEGNIDKAQLETNVQLKKTSDLLDSLEKAISTDDAENLRNLKVNKGKRFVIFNFFKNYLKYHQLTRCCNSLQKF